MSNTIDQRILEMQFNNKQFENGIQTSLKSLGQLEKGLELKGATNGLGQLEKNVEFISSKFSAFGIMGVTALQNIANQAFQTGERLVKSLTVEPIMAGFSEYETQINSIQTILANTQKEGTTLEDVTKALDELNAYADKTIYNFTEMTRNIGTFTAAGVKLDTATNAIQGIANLAAISGSTSQQASTAMYQLSQAMASGTVKLMDWNSVVNAGMGGQVFQDALKETAKAHGVAIDDMIKKHGSFRETLSEGWITTEVLTETLEKFTATTEGLTEEQIKANREMWKARGYTDEQIDAIFEMGKTATDAATKVKTFTQLFDTLKEAAQSGWTQSWEILVGDFEEAKTLLTAISDEIGTIINDSAAVRNNLLQAWKDAGGRDDIIEGVKNLYGLLKELVEPARQAFEEIFPPLTAEKLKSFTQGFEDFTKNLKVTSQFTDRLKGTLKGFFNIINVGAKALSVVGKAFKEMAPPLIAEHLSNFAKIFEDLTKSLKVTPQFADKLSRSFKGLFAIVDIGAQALTAVGKGFVNVLRSLAPVGSNLLDMAASTGDFLVTLSDTIRESGFFQTAMDGIGKAVKWVAEKFGKLTEQTAGLFGYLSTVDLSGIEIKIEPLKALAEAGSWVMEKLKEAYVKALPTILTVSSYISKAFGGVASSVTGMVQDGTLNQMATGGVLVALIAGIKKVADAISNIGKSASGILDNIAGIFEGVTGALEGMQNKLNAEALKSIATAVAILAASLVAISLINQDNVAPALGAITAMFVELIAALGTLIKVAGGSKMMKLMSAVKIMKGLASAVLVLAAAMAIMGTLDTEGVIAGVAAVTALTTMLVVVVKKLGAGGTQLMKGAGSLISLAAAVGILALSVKVLGNMDLDAIGKGLLALGGILAEFALFTKVYNVGSLGISAGIGLLAMSAAILVMSAALRIMGSMDIVSISKGLLAMAGCMTILCVALELLPDNMLSIGAGLLAVSAALVIIGAALRIMGGMDIVNLAKGLSAMALSMTILVVAANLMKGSIGGAAAILVMSAALIAMGVALRILGGMAVGEIAKSLITLAATLAIIGGAAALLAPLTPAMLALGAALLVFGVGAAATGAALLVLGIGLSSLGVGLTALVTAIVASVTAIVAAIPVIAEQIGAAVVAIAEAISAAAPACSSAISAVIQAIVDIIVNGIVSISNAIGGAGPAILKLAGILLVLGAAAAVLAPLVPAIVALSAGLVAFGISCATIAAGVTLLAGALALLGASGLVVASSLADIYNTIDKMGDLSLDAVKDSAKAFKSAGKKAAENVLQGFDSAAVQGMTASMQKFVNTTISTFALGYSEFKKAGQTLMTNLSYGINATRYVPVNSVSQVGSSMTSEGYSWYSDFYQIGGNIARGLANGINANRYLVENAARNLGLAAKNATMGAVDAHSPAREFENIGMWIDMGLANGLMKFAKLATNAATYLGESTIQPVMTMTGNMLGELGSMGSALRGTAALASSLDSSITSEQYVTVDHTFGELTVKGVNDRGEFIAVADYAVEEMMTELMRKGIRR